MAFKIVNQYNEIVDIQTGLTSSIDELDLSLSSLSDEILSETNRATAAEEANAASISSVISNTDLTALDSLSELVLAFEAADSDLKTRVLALETNPLLSFDDDVIIATDKKLILGNAENITMGYNSIDTSIVFSVPPRVSDENYVPTLSAFTPETHPLDPIFNDFVEPIGTEPWVVNTYSPIRAYEDLPTNVDLRIHNLDIDDQGNSGSCVGNAAASILEVLTERINRGLGFPGVYTNFSFMFLYWELRNEIGETGIDGGSWPHDAFDEVKEHGICEFDVWNKESQGYANASDFALIQPSAAAYTNALNYRIEKEGGYKSIDNLNLVLDMKEALSKGLPVMASITVTNAIFGITGPIASHTYRGSLDGSVAVGGHAMAALGYDDSLGGFIVENSWGSGWGDGGYMLLPYDVYEADSYAGETVVTTSFMGVTLDGDNYIDYGANNDIHFKSGDKKCLSIINSSTPHVELFSNGYKRLSTSTVGLDVFGQLTADTFKGDASQISGLENTLFAQELNAQFANKVDSTRVLTDVPANAIFTDTISTYVHPATHSITEVAELQTALDAKVDSTRVLTDVPAGAVFTDTDTNNYVTGLTYVDGSLNMQQTGGLADLSVVIVSELLPVTPSPEVTMSPDQTFIGSATITNWDTYSPAEVYVTILDTAGNPVISSADITTIDGQMSIPLTVLTTGVSYVCEVRVLEVAKTVSVPTVITFAKQTPTYRYWRLAGFVKAEGEVSTVMIGNWSLQATEAGLLATYPEIMTTNTAPFPYVATAESYFVSATTYDPFRAFDSLTTTSWWTLGSTSAPADQWLQIDLGVSVSIDSMIITTGLLAGYAPSSITILGSDTGEFLGDEVNLGTFSIDTTVATDTTIG
jgi:hypothetical protein